MELYTKPILLRKTVVQLKDILVGLGVKKSGVKADLIDRILLHAKTPTTSCDIIEHTTTDIYYYIMDFLESHDVNIVYELNIRYKYMTMRYAINRFPFQMIGDSVFYTLNRHKLITKTRAMTEYRIRKPQFDNLKCKSVTNPHFACASDMQLYSLGDIIPISIQRFGTIDNLKQYNNAHYAKSVQIQQRKIQVQSKREEDLINTLYINGLNFRNDSKLCKKYIGGDTNDITSVIRRMKEVNHFFSALNGRQKIKNLDYYVDGDVIEECEHVYNIVYPHFDIKLS